MDVYHVGLVFGAGLLEVAASGYATNSGTAGIKEYKSWQLGIGRLV